MSEYLKMNAWADQITAAHTGWRTQFRLRGPRHRPGVVEVCRYAST